MNKQKPGAGIEWTRPIRLIDGVKVQVDGYTWNPVGGCKCMCAWKVFNQNGIAKNVICYAKANAESERLKRFYPNGFEEIYIHESRLDQPLKLKKPAGIFLDSMSDLMGVGVPSDFIQRVLDVCKKAYWHSFFLLTKNPKNLLKYEYPDNVWVGVSSPADFMYGKELSDNQKHKYMNTSLSVLAELKKRGTAITWMSLEPLTHDWSSMLSYYQGALSWAIVGAASEGNIYYAPVESNIVHTVSELERQNIPVFYKGNMSSSSYAKSNWKAEFPLT